MTENFGKTLAGLFTN